MPDTTFRWSGWVSRLPQLHCRFCSGVLWSCRTVFIQIHPLPNKRHTHVSDKHSNLPRKIIDCVSFSSLLAPCYSFFAVCTCDSWMSSSIHDVFFCSRFAHLTVSTCLRFRCPRSARDHTPFPSLRSHKYFLDSTMLLALPHFPNIGCPSCSTQNCTIPPPEFSYFSSTPGNVHLFARVTRLSENDNSLLLSKAGQCCVNVGRVVDSTENLD